jgi:transcriptional regulator with XRE-family HTH domain
MEMAVELRVGLSTIQAWEQGSTTPDYERLWKIWLVFHELPFEV